MTDALTNIHCPECGADRPYKNGHRAGRQLYKCQDCGRQFGGGQYPSGKRFPDAVIADALRQYYEGQTYREVAVHLSQKHGITDTAIAPPTVMRWVRKYTDAAVRALEGLKANVGEEWNFDLSATDNFGNSCWQVFDRRSGYLVTICYFRRGETISPSKLINVSETSRGSLPRVMYTRCWPATGELGQRIATMISNEFPQIEIRVTNQFAFLTEMINSPEYADYNGNPPMKNIGSRFKSECSANSFLLGWKVSYNFIKRRDGGKRPPGSHVVSNPPFKSWRDVIALERMTSGSRRAGLLSC